MYFLIAVIWYVVYIVFQEVGDFIIPRIIHVLKVARDPNLIIQLSRQDEWANEHLDIMGPRNAFFYFGPSNSPGQLAYGNAGRVGMIYYLRKRRETSK